MREFNIVLRSEDGAYNPFDEAIIEHPALARKGVTHFDLMPDGTTVLLYDIAGDADAVRGLLDETPGALSYDVFTVGDGHVRAHVHFEEETLVTALINLQNEHDLITNPPLEIDADGGLHMSVAGDPENIREAAMMRPENVDIRLEETEGGDVDMVDVTTLLTDRQQEVLELALEKGYYEIPRQATNEDIAAELDCSTSTVGEHLRKIESRIISEVGPT